MEIALQAFVLILSGMAPVLLSANKHFHLSTGTIQNKTDKFPSIIELDIYETPYRWKILGVQVHILNKMVHILAWGHSDILKFLVL